MFLQDGPSYSVEARDKSQEWEMLMPDTTKGLARGPWREKHRGYLVVVRSDGKEANDVHGKSKVASMSSSCINT